MLVLMTLYTDDSVTTFRDDDDVVMMLLSVLYVGCDEQCTSFPSLFHLSSSSCLVVPFDSSLQFDSLFVSDSDNLF